MIDFRTEPSSYRHWKLSFDAPMATLAMDVNENAPLNPGYDLKLNSYDLGVDIELNDAVQRLRFEHPEIGAVVLTSGKERVFCAGANIRMLGQSSHGFKVNFCKFTNETRNAIEEASGESKQAWLAVVNGPCAGGGYELALATDRILMADDGSTTVALPEVPLLAVLPGTGGLTRLVDKRRVRRDRADYFCTIEEGIKGQRAVEWRLVDEVVPRSRLAEATKQRAGELAARSDRPAGARGIALGPLERRIEGDRVVYAHVTCAIDRPHGVAEITVAAPDAAPPSDTAGIHAAGTRFWPLAVARELDDLILHLRTNEEEIGLWVLRTSGAVDAVEAHDRALHRHPARAGPRRGPRLHAGRSARGRRPARGGRPAHRDELRRLSDRQRAHPPREPIPRRAGARGRPEGPHRRGPGRGRRGGGGSGDVHPGRHRLGGRGADRHRGARRVLAGRTHRHGGLAALRRPGDAREQDLRPALRVAELDLPAAQRGGAQGRAQGVRHRRAGRLRPQESVMASIDYNERIPNNVNLAENRRLLRALEDWQPKFLE